jgi:hypothetical protein
MIPRLQTANNLPDFAEQPAGPIPLETGQPGRPSSSFRLLIQLPSSLPPHPTPLTPPRGSAPLGSFPFKNLLVPSFSPVICKSCESTIFALPLPPHPTPS